MAKTDWIVSDSKLQETPKLKDPKQLKSKSEAEVCESSNASTNKRSQQKGSKSQVWNSEERNQERRSGRLGSKEESERHACLDT